jgi:PleD family two-component response regulator
VHENEPVEDRYEEGGTQDPEEEKSVISHSDLIQQKRKKEFYFIMTKHICILEDDPGITDIIEILLSEEGYQVECYSKVHDFFSKKDSRPDLFILDVMLPDGNGLEVCKL